MYRNFNNNSTNDFINIYKFRFFLFLQQIIFEDGETDSNKYFLKLIKMFEKLVAEKKTKYTSLISILKFMKQNKMIDDKIKLTDIIDVNILKQLDNSMIYGSNGDYKNVNIDNKLFKDFNIKNNAINSPNFTSFNGKIFNNYFNDINNKAVNKYYDLPDNIKINLAKTLLTKLSKFIKTMLPVLKELTKIFKSNVISIDTNKKDNSRESDIKEIEEGSSEASYNKNNNIDNNIGNNIRSNNNHNPITNNNKVGKGGCGNKNNNNNNDGDNNEKEPDIPNNEPNIPTNPNKLSPQNNNSINNNENPNNVMDNPNNPNNPSGLNNLNNCDNTIKNMGDNDANSIETQMNENFINSEEEIEYNKNTNEIGENIEFGGAWENIDSFNIDKFKGEEQNDTTRSPTEKILLDNFSQRYLRMELGKLSVINKLFSLKCECPIIKNERTY